MAGSQEEKGRDAQRKVRQEIRGICKRISQIELVASGHVRERTTKCGKAGCRCADDPKAQHGPYRDWSRLVSKKLRQTRITAEEAQQLRHAIANHEEIRHLLKRWEELTWIMIRKKEGSS